MSAPLFHGREAALRIAGAQIECRPGDVAANVELHLAALREAKARRADLVLFPELSLTDYLPEPDIDRLARPADAPELRAIAEAAGPAVVSVGFIERTDSGWVHNAQALLSGGEVLHVHRKANLPTYGRLREGRVYAPGRSLDLAPLASSWRMATLICADTWNPALPWLAAVKGADLLLVPVASVLDAVDQFDNPAGWDLNLRHTALTYGLPVAMVNHCGSRNGLDFWGGSRILDAFGREVARAGSGQELIVADLDLAQVAAARHRLPTVRDADPQLIQAELTRLLGGAQ